MNALGALQGEQIARFQGLEGRSTVNVSTNEAIHFEERVCCEQNMKTHTNRHELSRSWAKNWETSRSDELTHRKPRTALNRTWSDSRSAGSRPFSPHAANSSEAIGCSACYMKDQLLEEMGGDPIIRDQYPWCCCCSDWESAAVWLQLVECFAWIASIRCGTRPISLIYRSPPMIRNGGPWAEND